MSDTLIINANNPSDTIVINAVTSSSNVILNPQSLAAVLSVNGRTGIVVLDKNDVNLSNVDNTSDLDKPISNATFSALLLKADLNSFLSLNSFITANSGDWNSVYLTVTSLSSQWDSVYALVNEISGIEQNQQEVSTFVNNNSSDILSVYSNVNNLSSNWDSVYSAVNQLSTIEEMQQEVVSLVTTNSAVYDTLFTTPLSTLTYQNVEALDIYETIQTYAASNPIEINKGSNVTLTNGRVYTFAGTDVSNPAHYLEINTNPITPIYQELDIYDTNQAIVDTFSVSEFKSAKYTLQVETNFNNEIYYSEINIVGSVEAQIAVASEYGQISTSNIILGYTANYDVNQVQLIILFSADAIDSNQKLIIRGHRTNFYKI